MFVSTFETICNGVVLILFNFVSSLNLAALKPLSLSLFLLIRGVSLQTPFHNYPKRIFCLYIVLVLILYSFFRPVKVVKEKVASSETARIRSPHSQDQPALDSR
jgi:hypothetical protein